MQLLAMDLSLDFEWKTFDSLYALDSFGTYWSENEVLIQKAADEAEVQYGPKWKPTDEQEYGEYRAEVDAVRHLHDEIMTPMFRYSCIVMLYSVVERELRRLVENLESERGKQKLKVSEVRGDSFLGQVAKFVETFFSLRLPACPQYQGVCDLQKIRDCIVHSRGEVSLSRDKAYLVSLKDRRTGFFAWEGTDMEIRAECIEQFIRETWAFFIWVFSELQWKIDDSWKQKKWLVPSKSQAK
jgi:hypothetical protein